MPAIRVGLSPCSSLERSSRSAIGKCYDWSLWRGAIHEAVADAGLGDEPRGVRVVAELLADLAGVHPQVLRLTAVLGTPHLLQDGPVRQHAAGIAGQQRQERELLRGEVDRCARDL